ncbi:hypothetical protein [Parabacteroides merdae]|nr:hypothetical protein [Parabacteroides merdae]
MEGKKFKHKYLPYLTCVVVAATRKGYKVLEAQNKDSLLLRH